MSRYPITRKAFLEHIGKRPDVAVGEPGSCRRCPIANAIYLLVPKAKEVYVDGDETHVNYGVGRTSTYVNPPWVDEFIARIDDTAHDHRYGWNMNGCQCLLAITGKDTTSELGFETQEERVNR